MDQEKIKIVQDLIDVYQRQHPYQDNPDKYLSDITRRGYLVNFCDFVQGLASKIGIVLHVYRALHSEKRDGIHYYNLYRDNILLLEKITITRVQKYLSQSLHPYDLYTEPHMTKPILRYQLFDEEITEEKKYTKGQFIQLSARIEEVTENGYTVLIPGPGINDIPVTAWNIIGATMQIDDLVEFQQFLFEQGWLATNLPKNLDEKQQENLKESMRDVALHFFEEREREAR